jgi:uncharacterized protein (DUF488 family)
MKRHGVTHIVDVRAVPGSSYWVDFCRSRLEEIVPPTGLRYVYMGDTIGGVPESNALCRDPDSVALEPLWREPRFALGIERLVQAMELGERCLCLMCGCLRPHHCHRTRLIAPALLERQVRVQHLNECGDPIDHAVVELESRDPQLSLF